jgi:small-conductance mechanosensitive channel
LSVIRVFRLLLVALLIAASPARAAGDDTTRQTLDSARTTIADIETALKADNLSNADLIQLRATGDPLAAQLQAVIVDLSPRLDASAKRLAELTPKSKEPAVTDSASPELAAEKVKHDALDADLRSARAMLLQIDDIDARISAERRDLFTRETFARSSSVVSPLLWIDLAREAPSDASTLAARFGAWLSGLSARLTLSQTLGFLATMLAIVALAAPINWLNRRVLARDPAIGGPDRFGRALGAAWTAAVLAAAPLIALGVIAWALDIFDISDPHAQGQIDAVLDGLRLIVIAYALTHGLLAPGRANWRLVNLSDRAAAQIEQLWLGVAAILAAERLLEPAVDALGSLNIAIAGRAVGATLAALLLAGTLRRMAAQADDAAPPAWATARAALAWTLAALTIGATLSGYVAFATYIVEQTMELVMIVSTLFIVDAVLQEGADALLKPSAPIGRALTAAIRLRRDALDQIIVLVQGFARLTILVGGTMIVLGRWSVSQDFASSLRAAYFGFKIGGVTLSLSSLLVAGLALAIVMAATRALQNWLSSRYLPRTRLDAGVSNSIRTIVGYLGVLAALAISGAQLGLDFQKVAIVAGALSVGIGFGLQSIANNFVSGLILLWERGIRVGDWIVVGADQGFVRRINARATEIETFDRGTLIVPNATLVGGPVKNWMHADRTGRIVIAVSVAYESDVETARELLIAVAKAQDSVLAIPAPLVLFNQFGDWALKFELICYVDDIVVAERVRSEMNFDILRRMREAGLRIPYPK